MLKIGIKTKYSNSFIKIHLLFDCSVEGSIILLGNFDNTSRASAGHPALK